MANIFDYLIWRADVPFSVDPFNEVDNLVLSELVYTDFDRLVGEEPRSLEDVFQGYFSLHTREEVLQRTSYTGRSPLLMELMADSARFGGMQISHYLNVIDREKTAQIAAATFHLPDGTLYVAFRGTDGTLVGWREDFDLGFVTGTEGQRLAVDYLNQIGRTTTGHVRVGGHSKGGNFAVYAASCCEPDIQLRIREIYTNDGPGFREDFLSSAGYQRMLPRLISIIPDTSIIGMLLDSEGSRHVVDSNASGLTQHDAYTWEVRRNRFVPVPMTEAGFYLNGTIKQWISGMDDEERRTMTDTIFTVLESTGAENFKDVGAQKRKSLEAMYQAMRALPRDQQMDIFRTLGQLVKSGGKTAWQKISPKLLPDSDQP